MNWIGVALWGALVGLDSASCPQVMISRPLVAGAVTGMLLGSPVEGVLLGALLEVFALNILPVGAARNPETGPAAVAATAAYLIAPVPEGVAPVLLAVVFALGWERVSGGSVHLLRRLNERIAPDPIKRGGVAPLALEARHAAAMMLDFVRAGIVVAGGAWIGAAVLEMLASLWMFPAGVTAGGLAVATTMVLAAALSLFGGWRKRKIAFSLGLLCGLLLLLAQ